MQRDFDNLFRFVVVRVVTRAVTAAVLTARMTSTRMSRTYPMYAISDKQTEIWQTSETYFLSSVAPARCLLVGLSSGSRDARNCFIALSSDDESSPPALSSFFGFFAPPLAAAAVGLSLLATFAISTLLPSAVRGLNGSFCFRLCTMQNTTMNTIAEYRNETVSGLCSDKVKAAIETINAIPSKNRTPNTIAKMVPI